MQRMWKKCCTKSAAGLEGIWRAAWRRQLAQCRCTNFSSWSTYPNMWWSFHTLGGSGTHTWACKDCSHSCRTWQTNVSWSKKGKDQKKIDVFFAQASHDGAEADPEQGGYHLSTFQLFCLPHLKECWSYLGGDWNIKTYPAFRKHCANTLCDVALV